MAVAASRWQKLMQRSLSGNLPNEIVADILLRLPVKSLIRFTCVCKAWCTLCGDPKFTELQFKHGIANHRGCLLLRHLSDTEGQFVPWRTLNAGSYYIAAICGSLLCPEKHWKADEVFSLRNGGTFQEISKVEVPILSKTGHYSIVGSINGLICLIESHLTCPAFGLRIYLWNPATRECRALPEHYINQWNNLLLVLGVGFGYLSTTNDYKVVRIITAFNFETKVEVYSVSTDCWRSLETNIQCQMTQIYDYRSAVFMNQASHWVATDDANYSFILALDMVNETLYTLELPNDGGKRQSWHRKLAVLMESLLICIFDPSNMAGTWSIWVMKDYGVPESWTKLYKVGTETMIPAGLVDEGEFMLIKNSWLVSYDPILEKVKNLQVFHPTHLFRYIESLVSPRG
ncbi:F-box/kelch-repeat protein [Tripterygium wilfordii]|uniref:F-box/kelch-repeat protein n=1 Tax=Tripterygium wilfordii TaxID=458696 RepID=A0A7J7D533_TRIWF|nr:F-box/kelch-repeat protein At3g23880-like [Tripterygium wilfordii]KAF5741388.1 F-box/kelch-repeat protein [Tripterygium wilfordii]